MRFHPKLAAARMLGFSETDVYFLKSLRHSHWLWRAFRPGQTSLPLRRLDVPPSTDVTEQDVQLAARVIAYYDRVTQAADSRLSRSAMWDRNLATFQSPLIAALRQADEVALARTLTTFLRTQVVVGIDAGNTYTGRNWKIHSLALLDGLASLAEQLGVAPAESSHGPAGSAFCDGIPALVKRIEAAIGIDIGMPPIGAPYGIDANGTFITRSSPEYALVAWRLREAVRNILPRREALNCMEIGAGYGATAMFLLRLMGQNIRSYTLVDLPEIGCLQAYYLGRVLGAQNVSLLGEEDRQIKIVPPPNLRELPSVDIVLNQNSLPEIPHEVARDYVCWIRDRVRGFFFSYNHETLVPGGQFAVTVVRQLVAEVGGLRRIARNLSWCRPGYVEEIYAPERSG